MKIIKGKEYVAVIQCHRFSAGEEIDEDNYYFSKGETVIPDFVFFREGIGYVYLGTFKNTFDQTVTKAVPVSVFTHCFEEK